MTPRLLGRELEVLAELPLEQAVLEAQLLLLGERDGVLRLLAARPLGAMHAGRVILVLQRLGGAEQRNAEPAGELLFGTCVTSHKKIQ